MSDDNREDEVKEIYGERNSKRIIDIEEIFGETVTVNTAPVVETWLTLCDVKHQIWLNIDTEEGLGTNVICIQAFLEANRIWKHDTALELGRNMC